GHARDRGARGTLPRPHRRPRRRTAAPLRVDAALLQGDRAVRLQRLRHGDLAGPPPARDGVVLRVAARETHRRGADRDAPLRARSVSRGLPRLPRPGRERRGEGAVRLSGLAVSWRRATRIVGGVCAAVLLAAPAAYAYWALVLDHFATIRAGEAYRSGAMPP